MKVSGFTFIRNGNKLDYPYKESIRSLLPLCDELIVVVGNSEDNTRESILQIADPKIKIMDTIWDENMRQGGKILAQQTNLALEQISGDWGIYLQGDEVIHEKDYALIREKMVQYHQDPAVQGLLFNYKHFYGTYNYFADGTSWYRREIRIIKNIPGMHSYRDAQGFRINNKKIKVKHIDATIYHYGWVRNPRAQQLKNESFHKYWHDDAWMEKNIVQATEADYNLLESLTPFEGSHPLVMDHRISRMDWQYNYDPTKRKFDLKNWIKKSIHRWTGYLPGEYKNYKKI